jgi:hypothetical protein
MKANWKDPEKYEPVEVAKVLVMYYKNGFKASTENNLEFCCCEYNLGEFYSLETGCQKMFINGIIWNLNFRLWNFGKVLNYHN